MTTYKGNHHAEPVQKALRRHHARRRRHPGLCPRSRSPRAARADIKKRGKLTVGTEAAYEPFEFVENGQVVGYGHDVLQLMAAKLGVRLNR